jgi:hypothetical protein
MSNILKFKHEMFGEIRTMTDEQGEPWFLGKDVAESLGYKNVNKALADHVSEDDLTKRYPIFDNMGRKQHAIFINESGLYSLILSSKLPQAKELSRMAVQSFARPVSKWDEYNAPVTRSWFARYKTIALRTEDEMALMIAGGQKFPPNFPEISHQKG